MAFSFSHGTLRDTLKKSRGKNLIIVYFKICVLLGYFWWRFGKGKALRPAGPEFFRFSCQQQYFSGKHESELLVKQIIIGHMDHCSSTNIELCYCFCSIKLPCQQCWLVSHFSPLEAWYSLAFSWVGLINSLPVLARERYFEGKAWFSSLGILLFLATYAY